MLLGLLSIFFLILATAFFVGSEYAIVSVRRTRIEQLVSEGNNAARLVRNALDHLDRYIAAVQIGVTLATVGLGALGEPVLGAIMEPYLAPLMSPVERFVAAGTISIALAFLIVTILEIVLGEIVPKIFARQRAEATALALIRPLNIFVTLFSPLTWLVSRLSAVVLRMLGMRPGDQHGNVYSVEELEMLVVSSRQAGVLDSNEEGILRRVFDFGDLSTRQVMRPRTEIDDVPVNATLAEVIGIINETKHSRYPVSDNDLDHIIGILHVKDVFMLMTGLAVGEPQIAPFSVHELMRPIEAVPETLDVADLLNRMKLNGLHMALVVDEYGGTAGIVTLEDIVEEIVGEVRDEFEPSNDAPEIVVTPTGTIVDGLASIDDVNDALGLEIETESDTIGGFVFAMLGRKPEIGDTVTHNGFTLCVDALDGLRIARVRITQPQHAAQPAGMEASDE